MKTLIIFILSTFILFASTPNATNVAVYTKALGAVQEILQVFPE